MLEITPDGTQRSSLSPAPWRCTGDGCPGAAFCLKSWELVMLKSWKVSSTRIMKGELTPGLQVAEYNFNPCKSLAVYNSERASACSPKIRHLAASWSAHSSHSPHARPTASASAAREAVPSRACSSSMTAVFLSTSRHGSYEARQKRRRCRRCFPTGKENRAHAQARIALTA